MTEQEMQAMQAELQTRFPGLEVVIVHKMLPDHTTQTFVEHNWIAIFYDNICVSTIKSQQQLDAFINVARIMSQGQLETIGAHQGQCIECERVSIVSDASHLCEACTLEAQIGNDGQWEFKPLA